MGENKHRLRERMPLGASGRGKNKADGQAFYFNVTDFTADGMLLHVEGNPPPSAAEVTLAFHVEGLDGKWVEIELGVEVRYVKPAPEGGHMCGVYIISGQTDSLDKLDHLYLEKYFSEIA